MKYSSDDLIFIIINVKTMNFIVFNSILKEFNLKSFRFIDFD